MALTPEELEEKIAAARKKRQKRQTGPYGTGLPKGPFAMAMRISVEIVSALIVGVGIGLVIDHYAGTAPAGLIIMFVAGSAAGVLNVVRALNKDEEE